MQDRGTEGNVQRIGMEDDTIMPDLLVHAKKALKRNKPDLQVTRKV
jgi:hypothetical protein